MQTQWFCGAIETLVLCLSRSTCPVLSLPMMIALVFCQSLLMRLVAQKHHTSLLNPEKPEAGWCFERCYCAHLRWQHTGAALHGKRIPSVLGQHRKLASLTTELLKSKNKPVRETPACWNEGARESSMMVISYWSLVSNVIQCAPCFKAKKMVEVELGLNCRIDNNGQ